jgi:GT2 family glycosyltransferase
MITILRAQDFSMIFPGNRMTELVSIVIVDHNGGKMLRDCLFSVLDTCSGKSFEVIVVDNGSNNELYETAYRLLKDNPSIRWIRTGSNLFLGAAKNIGARAAMGKYIVFLDNDTITTPDWLEETINCLKKDCSAGAVQSLLLTPKKEIQHCGGVINSLGSGFSVHTLGRSVSTSSPMQVFFAAGAGTAIRRNLLSQIGFFDAHLTFSDDIELSWRLNLSGRKVYLCPKSVVIHRGGITTASSRRLILYRQRCYSYELLHNSVKNNSARLVAQNVPKIFWLLTLMTLQRVRQGTPKNALAVISGMLRFFRNFPEIWKERIFVQKLLRRVSDKDIQKQMLTFNWTDVWRVTISWLTGKEPHRY